MRCAVEVKAARKIANHHLKGLREVVRDHRGLKRRVVVCLETRPRRTEDGIDILPAADFAHTLWSGALTR